MVERPDSDAASTSRETKTPSGPIAPAGVVALALLSGVFAWWASDQGGYFGTTFYPGAAILCALLVLLALFGPVRVARRNATPVIVAVAGLIGLGTWAALSAIWSPTPDIAVFDGQRAFIYALSFGLGIWLCALLGSRVHLAMVPLAVAAAAGATVTIVTLLAGDHPNAYLETDGTLDFPLGYRNANAAFFLIALWPALGLAGTRELDWRLRALALAVATACLDVALLSQSRASVIAAAVALLVYVATSPSRARALGWALLAGLAAAVMVPAASDLYQAANSAGIAHATPELRAAGRTALGSVAIAILLGALVARIGPRTTLPERTMRRLNRAVAAALAVTLLAGVGVFAVATGDPIDWIGQKAHQFRTTPTPDLSRESTRFTLNAGSERYDLWRIAVDDFADHPILGSGGGGYQFSYNRQRTIAYQNVRDAHSVELETLTELGLPGALFLALGLGGGVAGAWRARRVGPGAAALSGIALTAGAYWLVHTSVDWFWAYPAVTAPVLCLLGSACAPGLFAPRASADDRGSRGIRAWLIAGAAALVLSLIPPYLAERYVNDAFAGWGSDVDQAYQDLDRAASLNRLSDEPLLAEGAIAKQAGDRARAIAAFKEAAERTPEEWAAHYFLGTVYERRDPARARRAFEVARRLNPLDEQVNAKLSKLKAAGASSEPGG